jgi:hypothetical protein
MTRRHFLPSGFQTAHFIRRSRRRPQFYYYLFYVLEKYIGRDQKYAGILDALKYVVQSKGGFKK